MTVEVPAPAAGVLSDIAAAAGSTIAVGGLLGSIKEGASAAAGAAPVRGGTCGGACSSHASRARGRANFLLQLRRRMPPAPSAAKILAENGIAAGDVTGSGKRGQVLKEDALAAAKRAAAPAPQVPAAYVPAAQPAPVSPAQMRAPSPANDAAREERVKMSRLRQTIARRLKDAQNTAAMLTTFNDVDMSAVMAMRSQYKDLFEKRHGVKLGFMSFFVKAWPAGAEGSSGGECRARRHRHRLQELLSHRGRRRHGQGPRRARCVREADRLSLSEIEASIAGFGKRAREGKLGIEDMQGGTFTISNGGVYGSMMSMPILNAPQSGILGMHRIEERPVVRNGQIVVRPMMYLALSYDHRIVDGKESRDVPRSRQGVPGRSASLRAGTLKRTTVMVTQEDHSEFVFVTRLGSLNVSRREFWRYLHPRT